MKTRIRALMRKCAQTGGGKWILPALEALEDRVAPAAMHWVGNSGIGGSLWNVPSNWFENRAPTNGDTLIFDTTSAGFSGAPASFTPTNNIVGLTNVTMTINDSSSTGDFSLSGNAI